MQESWCAKTLDEKKVSCNLCIIGCTIGEGQHGLCRTRENQHGTLVNTVEGKLSSFSTDFIEKVPLYHFYPNQKFLTVGGIGCNLSCHFCLTWNITQGDPSKVEAEKLTPDRLVEAALKLQCKGIAYTHSEPTLNIEFYSQVMEKAKARGLKNVVATNGFISIEAFERIAPLVDAVALTFKGNSDFYSKICGAGFDRSHFESFTSLIRQRGIHLELVYVLIPGVNDDDESLREVIELAKSSGAPLIFLRFFPSYKMEGIESPSESDLEKAVNTAYALGVEYAYMENIFEHPGKNTYCPQCRQTLIEREGYGIVMWDIKAGRCPNCSRVIPLVGEPCIFASSSG